MTNSRDKGADGEEWRPVVGYEDFYEVSNMGGIKSLDRYVRFVSKNGLECWRLKKGHELIPTTNKKSGRVSVMLTDKNSIHKRISLHRIVASAFVENENPEMFREVNHIDENPQNNKATNLEWCDRKYNMNYGSLPSRINKKNKKPVEAILNGDIVIRYDSVSAGKKDGYDSSGIIKSIKTQKKYKNLLWRYADVNK